MPSCCDLPLGAIAGVYSASRSRISSSPWHTLLWLYDERVRDRHEPARRPETASGDNYLCGARLMKRQLHGSGVRAQIVSTRACGASFLVQGHNERHEPADLDGGATGSRAVAGATRCDGDAHGFADASLSRNCECRRRIDARTAMPNA